MKIRIARTAFDIIRSKAEEIQDHEVCGLLIGRGDLIETVIPASNVASDPQRMFELDPVTLLAEHRRARTEGHEIIGHYHSHPGGRASPSLRDAANAWQNDVIWIIVGNAGDMGAFCAKTGGEIAGRFVPVELEVV